LAALLVLGEVTLAFAACVTALDLVLIVVGLLLLVVLLLGLNFFDLFDLFDFFDISDDLVVVVAWS
jgi:hypothetical protein